MSPVIQQLIQQLQGPCAPEGGWGPWIPFFQSLVWPVFLGIVLVCWRKHFPAWLNKLTIEVGALKLAPEDVKTIDSVKDTEKTLSR